MTVFRERNNKNRKYFLSFRKKNEMFILNHIRFKQRAVPPLTVRHDTPVPSQQEQHHSTTVGRLSSSPWYDQKHFSPLTNLSFAFVLPFNRRNKKTNFECGCRNLRFLFLFISSVSLQRDGAFDGDRFYPLCDVICGLIPVLDFL